MDPNAGTQNALDGLSESAAKAHEENFGKLVKASHEWSIIGPRGLDFTLPRNGRVVDAMHAYIGFPRTNRRTEAFKRAAAIKVTVEGSHASRVAREVARIKTPKKHRGVAFSNVLRELRAVPVRPDAADYEGATGDEQLDKDVFTADLEGYGRTMNARKAARRKAAKMRSRSYRKVVARAKRAQRDATTMRAGLFLDGEKVADVTDFITYEVKS